MSSKVTDLAIAELGVLSFQILGASHLQTVAASRLGVAWSGASASLIGFTPKISHPASPL